MDPNLHNPSREHSIEVIGQIRSYVNREDKSIPSCRLTQTSKPFGQHGVWVLQLQPRWVTLSKVQDLDVFYKKFVESRINGVKLGASPYLGGRSPNSASLGATAQEWALTTMVALSESR
ncbi:hypothetical protein NL676_010324 [Syzygium grande]|nr:hypothetical protein NL676_010324 [Syzygium grande]